MTHYTNEVDRVKQLIRDRDYRAAEQLLLECVRQTEAEDKVQKWGVAPWYYERLAIVYRKQKKTEAEIRILERFARQRHAPGVKPAKLLARLQALKDAAR